MASDTATAKAEPRPRRRLWTGSKLGQLILVLNLLGLAILIAGALILNEMRRGLVLARIDGLRIQGELIGDVLAKGATRGSPEPELNAEYAKEIIELLYTPNSQRVRLFDVHGRLVADSYVVSDRVEWRPLPPARKRGRRQLRGEMLDKDASSNPRTVARAQASLNGEVAKAMKGYTVAEIRTAQNGERVVSVSMPVQRVEAVLGVLTLEAVDVDKIIAAQRRALLPFILVAIGVTLLSSFLLTWLIARPVRRLARAADSVRLSRSRAISLPDIAARKDELGDLSRALQAMTATLSERMDAIERFAADVAHEIRNPLTSLRSAVETLDLVTDAAARRRLFTILKQDVSRLDRLITDISNASRLDAELSRDEPRAFDAGRLLGEIVGLYADTSRPAGPKVVYRGPELADPILVMGREGPLSQVFRNLVDNARSFSPEGGTVRVSLTRKARQAVVSVDDDGPGIPADNLETVFERFYTARPKGQAFGGHSGLGLSIARQIVQAHNGDIRAENRTDAEGKVTGARLSVSLPEART
ncbi:MAG TPA: stimulus-sensing domain-containing protein [Caulobacteraceae bacterium]